MNTKLYLNQTCIVFLLFFSFLAAETSAQTRKGERLVNEGRYEEAIKPLKRAFESDQDDRKAGTLLIDSYYRLQKYQEALDVAELMDMERSVNEQEVILFTDVLIANNDFSRAYLNLTRMLAESGQMVQGYKWLNKTGNLVEWDSVTTGSTVTEIQGLNTIYNEYAPNITDDELMYIADHLTVQVLYPSAFTNQSLHLLFTSPKTGDGKFGKAKMLIKGKDYYYHDGPIEKRPGEGIYAITLRDIEGLLYDLKMNIFFSELSGVEEDLIPFKYNGTYNTGHPTFSADGNRMYFASDRPGGFGQFDLWYTDWVDGEWTLPQNAGAGVNSPDNELYPKICNERLFFSSDRRDKGYGGLDLYYVSLLSPDQFPYNLRAPINSPYDDFAVDFSDEKAGYFSSNRTSGFGGDDIYQMFFQPATTVLDTITFVLEDRSGTKKSMRIFDSSGNEMVGINASDQSLTVSGLVTRELYTIEADSVFDTSYKLVAYNTKGMKVQEFNSDNSTFNVELLDQDEYNIAREENIDESELFELSGAVVSSEDESFDNISVLLEDESGTPIDEAKTDLDGRFAFKGLTYDQPYNLKTKGNKGEVEIDLMGQTGVPLTTLQKNPNKNSFAYTRTRPEADWMVYANRVIPVVYGIVPTADLSENDNPELRSLNDSLIRICDVDEDGFVEMGSLTSGHAYKLVFEKSSFDPKDKLVILDGSGDTTQTVRPDDKSSFVFELMLPKSIVEQPDEIDLAQTQTEPKETEVDEPEPVEALNETKVNQGLENLYGVSQDLKMNDEVKLYNSSNEFLSATYAKEDGVFNFIQVTGDSLYYVQAEAETPFKLTSVYNSAEKRGKLMSKGLWEFDYTNMAEVEKSINLPNIYYRFDSYTLSPESRVSLDNLYGFLVQNPNQKIKVLSHTDSRGPREYNERLSNSRAKEVVRYLIRRGINPDRLAYEGRGESQPINDCEDGTYCTNEKHAENRRTEFVLVKN